MIDAHHHLWQPARGDYGWMPQDHPILSRPYRLTEYTALAKANQVQQSVLVQAAPTVQETEYMLGIADSSDLIGAVVGWVDFEDPAQQAELERLARHPKFRSVRPMVQDIEDDNWLRRSDIAWAFEAISSLGLRFDALGFPRHARPFLEIFQKYPSLQVVIDHCFKPEIASGAYDAWAADLAQIAEGTSATIKLSGLVTEAGDRLSADALQPYVDHVLACFGPSRVMWGSDWPVSRLAMEYADWLALAQQLTAGLSAAESAMVFGGTAARFYGLNMENP